MPTVSHWRGNPAGDTAATADLVSCPVAAELLDELIVYTQDEQNGRPLPDEQGAVVITKHLQR